MKSRDYKTENVRRGIGQVVERTKKMFGPGAEVSFYRIALNEPIIRALGREKADELIMSGKIAGVQIRHLSEIARVNPSIARELVETPEKITPAYRKYRTTIVSLKRKRIDAQRRIERAWSGTWQRWLEKFESQDWPAVRRECARRIMTELNQEELYSLLGEL